MQSTGTLLNNLTGAIASCETEIIHRVLTNHPELVNAFDERGRTPLIIALDLGYGDMVELLLERGANPDRRDKSGRHPVIISIEINSLHLLAPLLRHGANAGYHDPVIGETYLDTAYKWKAYAVVSALRKHGANLQRAVLTDNEPFRYWIEWESLALFAADFGKIEELRKSLDHGVDPNLRSTCVRGSIYTRVSRATNTLLVFAARRGDEPMADLLLSHGADPSLRGEWGYTPLHHAIMEENIKLATLLLDNGADPNATDDKGVTSLMWAAKVGAVELGRLLISRGAHRNLRDHNGNTASDYAAKRR